ncbi:unnamed protein product [Chilo suppressalis]|uniref:Cilia- and flagella-associated protein 97 n=1 Tax=Chilo suppressalis TaxID=168631 RepID=A0ABN8AWQ7_CHISP|nr:hypothetical protein evm_003458 [Chilo suppressalis]CAH0397067.1 unnamed protein product [Chilo suppressalis]
MSNVKTKSTVVCQSRGKDLHFILEKYIQKNSCFQYQVIIKHWLFQIDRQDNVSQYCNSTLDCTMSHRESNIELDGYIDTEYSSGDANRAKTKHYQEENNNEINELSKELSEMGCIVDAVKRPPNVCIETCVYDSEQEEEKTKSVEEEDAYSDEFEEEDKSDGEVSIRSVKSQHISGSENSKGLMVPSSIKLSKSQSSMSHKAPASVSGRSSAAFGSVSVPSTRRINMSFSNERLREIERHNHILLTKILSARNSKKSCIPGRDQPPRRAMPSAAVSRKNQQRQIDRENMILLKKIQRAKSSVSSMRR